MKYCIYKRMAFVNVQQQTHYLYYWFLTTIAVLLCDKSSLYENNSFDFVFQ